MTPYNISFIGAGNVAEALCHGLRQAGQRIISVSSKQGDSAKKLAAETGALWIRENVIPDNCDIVIIAVPDNAIAEVSKNLAVPENVILAHTAGSMPLESLGRTLRAGVLYPLQTFSRGFSTDLHKVPFFIEATDRQTFKTLKELSLLVGSGAWECNTARRMHLHVAAVFANNFSNFMMTAGELLAFRAGFDPSLLKPLMEETMRKTILMGPSKAQTGPAVRHDIQTINSHLELLSFSPEYKDLYRQISKLISEYYKKTGE